MTVPEHSSSRSGQQDNLCAEPVVGAMEPVAWKITRAKKVYGVDLREAFGEFYAGTKAVADEYAAKGWTVTPLYTASQLSELQADAERYRWLRDAVLSNDSVKLDALNDINRNPKNAAEFDATIDAARKEQP